MGKISLGYVFDTRDDLKKQGKYEIELVRAFSGCHWNYWQWALDDLEYLFRFGDSQRILDEGSEMPEGVQFTLYRGVAGKVPFRKEAGLSWTRNLEKAMWFAGRESELEDPAVYQTTVSRVDVRCYINFRGEDEFVVRATNFRRLDVPIVVRGK